MKWFRLYSEFRSDPKIRRLPKAQRCEFITLLCLANEGNTRGVIELDDEDLAFELELSLEDWQTLKSKFKSKGFIDFEVGKVTITNWHKRQFSSDSSAERVKAHREKKKPKAAEPQKQPCNVTETGCNVTETILKQDVTPPDTDPDTDTYSDSDSDTKTEDPIEEKEKTRACKKIDRPSSKKIQLPEQEEKIDHSTNPEGPGAARAVVHEFVEVELVEDEPRSIHPVNQGLGRAALDVLSAATRTACDRQTHALVCTARQDASFVRFKSVYSRLANVVSGRPNGFGNSQAAEEEWMQLRADGYEIGEAFWAGLEAFREQSIAAFNAEGRVIGFKGARNFLRDRDWEQALETQADLEAIKASGFKSKSEKSKAEIAAEERAATSARVYAKLKAEGRCP